MKKSILTIFILIGVFLWGIMSARAELHVDITQGIVEPLPIALPDFEGNSDQTQLWGNEITSVINADLKNSGLFAPVSPDSYIQTGSFVSSKPRFADWRLINAQALVIGRVVETGQNRIRVEFRLYDVFSEKQLEAFALTGSTKSWRRLAHKVADMIYKRLTGEAGYFDTQLVYVSETGAQTERVKRIAIMDQDGANHEYITQGTSIILTPRLSPDGETIAYLDYGKRSPRVFLMNLRTKKREVLGKFPGMTFAPRFSPDGRYVLMSYAERGNSSIYSMDLTTRQVRRLTQGPYLDTSPCFSPDMSKIVFNSNRGGSQQIYVMNADGSNIQRISFGHGRYATPVWSPRGDMIAYTKMAQGNFYIGTMRPDGAGERLLSDGYIVEDPEWSPNGRVILFKRQHRSNAQGLGGNSRIYAVDLTGNHERVVSTPQEASGGLGHGRAVRGFLNMLFRLRNLKKYEKKDC